MIGVWKLYKIEYKNGSSKIITDNIYLELSKDSSFLENNEKGYWMLSFMPMFDKLKPILMRIRPNDSYPYNKYSSSVNLNIFKFRREINTNYLILSEFEDLKTEKYYIKQN